MTGSVKKKMIACLFNIKPAFIASFIKKMVFFKREVVETADGSFFIDSASEFGYRIILDGTYELGMVEILKRFLNPGGVFIDLGANEGYFSVIASRLVGREGRVIAVEPQERLKEIIKKNSELNGCDNIDLVSIAVSDKEGIGYLYMSPDMNTGSSSFIKETLYPVPRKEVKTKTLANIFADNNLDRCDLIKIDIEGWEYNAIFGSPDIFKEHRIKAIALETHPKLLARRGLSEEAIFEFLSASGYRRAADLKNLVFIAEKL